MNLHTTANAGVGLASLSVGYVFGIIWAVLFFTMLIALIVALSHFLPRQTG